MKHTSKRIGFLALFIVILLIGSMIYVTFSLKKESEFNHLDNTKLHLNSFAEQITQTVVTIDKSIDNIALVINKKNHLETRVKDILFTHPFIRSINILNEKNRVIYSSNKKNLNHTLSVDDHYPKPLFFGTVLRFGESINARDLFQKDDKLSIVPISKEVSKKDKKYTIIIVVSNDYFINKFSNNLHKDTEELQIIRIDGKVLFSTKYNFRFNKDVNKTKLYESSLENVYSAGIEEINGKKYISAYSLTDTYPLMIVIKLDYNKVMEKWEKKNRLAIFFLSIIIILIALIILKLLSKYTKAKNKEIKYQKQFLQNQEKLRNAYIVYNNTNDGILITDKHANILDINNAFLKNTGYKKEEILGENPKKLQSGLYDKTFYENMWKAIKEKHYWHGEIINKNKQGETYTELLTINQVLDEKEEVKNYIGVFTNISKEKEQELELKEKERFIFQQSKMASMGEMLENIAHQWRQPLSIISTAATGTKMEKELGISKEETEIERLTLINDSAQFLSQTIDDFRDFFKPDKEKEDFFIGEVIEKALNIVQSKFKNRNIKIRLEVEEVQIKEFKSELVQVIMNILNNARDVLETKDMDERYVCISVSKNEKEGLIEIKDSGGGMTAQILDKVFEPYFTTKHQSQGTGIGLYMSEEIIKKHMNGTIKAANTKCEIDGKTFTGAVFTIAIPLT